MADCGRRRLVACALRREAAYRAGGTMSEWWCRLHEAVTGVDDYPQPRETLLALADLIEPEPGRTCRMADDGVGPESCMGCGARVVEYM